MTLDRWQESYEIGSGFKWALRTVGDHYEWNYDDRVLPTDPAYRDAHLRVEDTGHANSEVALAYQLYREGLEFFQTDMQRLANTFTDTMWQSSQQFFTVYVDGTNAGSPDSSFSRGLDGWLELVPIDPDIWTRADAALRNPQVGKISPAYPTTFAKMLLHDPSDM